jgi:hypothetical protein
MISTRMPKLFCSQCGAKAAAACDCGVPYIPAGIAAALAVAAHPEKSDRAIAKETGIARATIQRARTGSNEPVDNKRIGLDGRARRLPRHDNPTQAELVHLPAAVNLIERLRPLMNALKNESKHHEIEMSPDRVGRLAHQLRDEINESLSPATRAKACEVVALEWKIDETRLNMDVINAVRAAARAWSDLHERMLAAAAGTNGHKAETRMREEVQP